MERTLQIIYLKIYVLNLSRSLRIGKLVFFHIDTILFGLIIYVSSS